MFVGDVLLQGPLVVSLELALLLAAGNLGLAPLLLLQVALPPGPADTGAPDRHEVHIPDMSRQGVGGLELLAAVLTLMTGLL